MKLRKLLALLLVLVMAFSVLAACSSDDAEGGSAPAGDSSGSGSGSGGGSDSSSSGSSSDAASDGGEVVLNVGSTNAMFLNGLEATGKDSIVSTNASGVQGLVYDTLFYPDETGTMVSDIVTEYSYSEDNLEFTFTIRDDVTFASGDTLTAEDILFSLACKQTSARPAYYTPINVEKSYIHDDGLTITFVYDFVFGPGIKYLDFTIANKSFYESLAPDGDYSAVNWYDASCVDGTGPYVIKSYTQDNNATLVLRDNYWGDISQYEVDTFNLFRYTDATTMYIDFENKVIDVAIGIASEDAVRLQDNGPEHGALGLIESNAVVMLCMNERKNEYLADPVVREAIAHALDTEVITDVCMGIYGTPAKSTLSQNMPAFVDGYSYDYDPDYSRQIMADAGYAEGEIVLTYITTSASTEQTNLAELVQSYLDDIGITVNIETYDMGTMLPMLMQGLSDFQRQTTSDGTPQLEVYECYSALPEDSVFQAVGIPDAEINEQLRIGYSNVDESIRNAAYGEVQRLLYESFRHIPLYEWKTGFAYNVETIEDITILSANKVNLRFIDPA